MDFLGYHAMQLAPVALGMSSVFLLVVPNQSGDRWWGVACLIAAIIFSYSG